jgi:hypothetical protein
MSPKIQRLQCRRPESRVSVSHKDDTPEIYRASRAVESRFVHDIPWIDSFTSYDENDTVNNILPP